MGKSLQVPNTRDGALFVLLVLFFVSSVLIRFFACLLLTGRYKFENLDQVAYAPNSPNATIANYTVGKMVWDYVNYTNASGQELFPYYIPAKGQQQVNVYIPKTP